MKLTLRSNIAIELDNKEVETFSSHYYPLDNETADIFISSMTREHQKAVNTLLDVNTLVTPETITALQSVFAAELHHAVELVDVCSVS